MPQTKFQIAQCDEGKKRVKYMTKILGNNSFLYQKNYILLSKTRDMSFDYDVTLTATSSYSKLSKYTPLET